MSLINQLSKLAGVEVKSQPKTEAVEPDKDFSPEEMKVVRGAVVKTIKYLEQEARSTQRGTLTKVYISDADAYDKVLELILRGHREAAMNSWRNQDTGCRDHIFDVVKDPADRKIVAKYLGTKLLHESVEILNEDETFYIVLDATEHSTFSDVFAKVNSKSLKYIILGSSKDQLEDLMVFSSSHKQEAVNLANARLKKSGAAVSEGTVTPYDRGMKDALTGKPCPYPKGSGDEKEWKRGWDVSGEGTGEQAKKVHESEDRQHVAFGKSDPEKLEYDAEHGDGYAKARLKGYTGSRKQWEEDRYFGGNDEDDEVSESVNPKNHLGERTFQTFSGWKKACKQVNPNVWFDGDADIAQAMVGPKPYVRGETKSIGEWDGAEGSIYVKESEQLDEISKKTLGSYIKKAVDDVSYHSFKAGEMTPKDKERLTHDQKAFKRQAGIEKAAEKLTSESTGATDYDDNHNPNKTGKTRKELLAVYAKTKDKKDGELAFKAGATAIELKTAMKESEEPKVAQLDTEQEDLEKQTETKPETEKVPPEVIKDLTEKIKEIKFKIAHLSHIDPTYQSEGYWVQFVVEMEKILDMLKLGTEEQWKEAATKLQTYENVALAEVPDSLWKFLSFDMYKTPEQRKNSLSKRFQEIKQNKGE